VFDAGAVISVAEPVDGGRTRLVISAPFDELPPELRDACAEPAGRPATIAGFRRGKIPFKLIDQRIGAAVLPARIEEALLALVADATGQHAMEPIGRPEIEVTGCGGRQLDITAVVDVRPAIVVPDITGTVVTVVRPIAVDDTEIDDYLAILRKSAATPAELDSPALRVELRHRLALAKHTARLHAVRDEALGQLTNAAAVPVPAGVLGDEIEYRKQWMLTELARVDTSLADYLTAEGKSEEQLDAELHDAVAQRLRSQLLLDAVAAAEGVQVSAEEQVETLEHNARRAGVPVSTYYHQLAGNGATDTIVTEVRRAKALAVVLGRISIVDTDGRLTTVADLRAEHDAVSRALRRDRDDS
jgi:FKBP-type peptidyl-prolyl cis-trans isomerase (trigger factor)